MVVGGFNSIKPEEIHPSKADSDTAEVLIARAKRQYAGVKGKDFSITVTIVAHMVAMAELALFDAPNKTTCAIEEDIQEDACYLLLAQQLKDHVACDLYFPDLQNSLSMIKAFTGVEYNRGEIT